MNWLLLLLGIGAVYAVSQQGSGNSTPAPSGGGGGGGGSPAPVATPPNWPTWAPSPQECQAAMASLPPEFQNAAKSAIETALKVKPFNKDGLINLAKTLETGGFKQAGLCIRALVEYAEKQATSTPAPAIDMGECDNTVANAIKLLPEPVKSQVWNVYSSGTAPKDAVNNLVKVLKSSGSPPMLLVADCLKKKYGIY